MTCRTGSPTSVLRDKGGSCRHEGGGYRQGRTAALGLPTGAGAEGLVRGAQEAVPGAEHQVRRVRGPGHKVGEAVPLLSAPSAFCVNAVSRCRRRARLRMAFATTLSRRRRC
jgi:hypothetical protein